MPDDILVAVGVSSAGTGYYYGFLHGLQSRAETINSLEAELADLRHWKAVEKASPPRPGQ